MIHSGDQRERKPRHVHHHAIECARNQPRICLLWMAKPRGSVSMCRAQTQHPGLTSDILRPLVYRTQIVFTHAQSDECRRVDLVSGTTTAASVRAQRHCTVGHGMVAVTSSFSESVLVFAFESVSLLLRTIKHNARIYVVRFLHSKPHVRPPISRVFL